MDEFNLKEKIKLYETGLELKTLRKDMGKSLQEVSSFLDISVNYLSEIERGLKVPSDCLIERLALFYSIDENYLFEAFNKIPKIARSQLEEHKALQNLAIEIGKKKWLTKEQKDKIYNQLYETFINLSEEEDV